MAEDRVNQLALEVARHNAHADGERAELFRHVETLNANMKEITDVMQSVRMDATRMASATERAADVLQQHVRDDRESFQDLRETTHSLSRIAWRLTGALTIIMVLINLLVPVALKWLFK